MNVGERGGMRGGGGGGAEGGGGGEGRNQMYHWKRSLETVGAGTAVDTNA